MCVYWIYHSGKLLATQENYLCMQVTFSNTKIFILCNDVIHLHKYCDKNFQLNRISFSAFTNSYSKERSPSLYITRSMLVLTSHSHSHSLLPLINIILICVLPCWSPIYFVSMEYYNMIFVNRTNVLRIRWVCVYSNPYRPTNQKPIQQQQQWILLIKQIHIKILRAFDAWIHIHLLRVFRVNLVQDKSQTISYTNKRSGTHSTQRNFAQFSVSLGFLLLFCLYAWKSGTNTRTHSNCTIAIAN